VDVAGEVVDQVDDLVGFDVEDLVALGDHTTDEAIATVREARKGTVQTREQEDFVRLFEETVRNRGS
jgi:hypothetical protein